MSGCPVLLLLIFFAREVGNFDLGGCFELPGESKDDGRRVEGVSRGGELINIREVPIL